MQPPIDVLGVESQVLGHVRCVGDVPVNSCKRSRKRLGGCVNSATVSPADRRPAFNCSQAKWRTMHVLEAGSRVAATQNAQWCPSSSIGLWSALRW